MRDFSSQESENYLRANGRLFSEIVVLRESGRRRGGVVPYQKEAN